MLKKRIVFIIALMVIDMVGCVGRTDNLSTSGGDPLVDRQLIDGSGLFNAKILEIRGTYVLVEPLEDEAIFGIADRISFESGNLNKIDVSVGDYVTIRFDGTVMKSYPAQILAISWSKLQTNPGTGGGDPVPTHWYGCAFSESANTSPRNGTHFLLSITYADALEKITQHLGTNDGTAVNPNLTSSLISNKINWVIIEEEVINANLFHVRLIQDVNGVTSGVYWNYNPSKSGI
jgi:hypothetical protein